MSDYKYLHLNGNNAKISNGEYKFAVDLPNVESVALKSMNISNTGLNVYRLNHINKDLNNKVIINSGSTDTNVSHTLQWLDVNTASGDGLAWMYGKVFSFALNNVGHKSTDEIILELNAKITETGNNNTQKAYETGTSAQTITWAFSQDATSKLVNLNLTKGTTGITNRYIIPLDSQNSLWRLLGFTKNQIFKPTDYAIDTLFPVQDLDKKHTSTSDTLTTSQSTIDNTNHYISELNNLLSNGIGVTFSTNSVDLKAQGVPLVDNSSGFYVISNKICGNDSYLNQIQDNNNRFKQEGILKWIPNSSPRYHHLEYESQFLEFHNINGVLSNFDIKILNDEMVSLNESVLPSWKATLILKMHEDNGGYTKEDMKKIKNNAFKKQMCPC